MNCATILLKNIRNFYHQSDKLPSNIIKAELLKGKNTITVERIGSHTTLTPVLLQSIRITKK